VKKKKACLQQNETDLAFNDIIIFKRCRARARRARRVALEAKSSSWQPFSTSLTSNTKISKVLKVIKSLSGHRYSFFIPTLHA